MDWNSKIKVWNTMTQNGQGEKVVSELLLLKAKEIPENYLASIANLCWRLNLSIHGISLLYPYVRLQLELKQDIKDELLCEYAACLLEMGATHEAQKIISEVPEKIIKANFYRSLIHFKKWDYAEALPHLQIYLDLLDEGYQKFVARVNLAAAYINQKMYKEAELQLEFLLPVLANNKHNLLLGNCYELCGQIQYFKKDFKKSMEYLEKSESLLRETKNWGWLYTKKWQWLNRCESKKDLKLLSGEYLELKKIAIEMKSWESIREIDLHYALNTNDEQLLNQVYFGTPFSPYRNRILEFVANKNPEMSIKDYFILNPQAKNTEVFSLTQIFLNEDAISTSFLPALLIFNLFSDLYVPFRPGQLFSLLYPDEYFDPNLSLKKLYQIVERSKKLLFKLDIGGEIESTADGYRLKLDFSKTLSIEKKLIEFQPLTRDKVYYHIIYGFFKTNLFSATDLTLNLKLAKRSCNRIIKKLIEGKHLVVNGKGKNIKYQLSQGDTLSRQ